MNLFSECDILSCPQHVEAKKLANKLWRKLGSVSLKQGEEIDKQEPDPIRLSRLVSNYDDLERELSNVRRGLQRCCEKP